MGWLWTLIIGAVIGAIAGTITSRDMPLGCIGNIIGGLLGAKLGQMVFGTWGPELAGMALVPSILGAVIIVAIISLFIGRNRN